MSEELKPCPFCGGEAKRFTIGKDEPNNVGGDVIVCTRCQASSHVEFGRKENLVSSWNRRSTPTEDARLRVQVLEEALGELRREAWFIIGVNHPAIVKADAALGKKETDRHG